MTTNKTAVKTVETDSGIKKQESRKDNFRPFQKLTQKELQTLKECGKPKKLSPGDVLLKGGEITSEIFIILRGKIKLIKGLQERPAPFITLGEGDWVGDIVFDGLNKSTSSAVASEGSIVIAIDKSAISNLEQSTQLLFYKHLSTLYDAQFSQLEAASNKHFNKVQLLTDTLFDDNVKVKTDFRHMEIIRNIIKKVPRLPVFASTLSTKLLEDKLSTEQVAEGVMKDPSLVAIVLKTINSAYYGFEKKISDIRYAIVLLGFDMMYQLVISEGVKRTMPDTPVFKELHTHSVIVSQLATTISQESNMGSPAEMTTIGLLHDLGQTVIQLLKEKNPKLNAFMDTLDRAQMGALLLKSWNLPDIVWQSAEFQFYPKFSLPKNIPVEVRNHTTILYLAHLIYDMFRGLPEKELPIIFLDDYMQLLNWKGLSLKEIVDQKILPALLKKAKTFPKPMRQIIEHYNG